MDAPLSPFDTLVDLESRHDDLLRQLDELDQRVRKVLSEYLPASRAGEIVRPQPSAVFPQAEPPAAAA